MDQKYEQFIDNGTKILLELFSMPNVDDGERRAVSATMTDCLAANIANQSNMPHPEVVIHTASLMYIDKKLTGYMTAKSYSRKDYDVALSLCKRLSELLKLFQKNGWKLPETENPDPAVCEAELVNWRDRDERTARILRLDADISTAVATAETELTQEACDHLSSLVEKLQFEIKACHKKKDSLPHIQYYDLDAVREHLEGLRKASHEKTQAHTLLIEINRQLITLRSSSTIDESQLCKAIVLCQQAQLVLLRCQNNQWSLPSIRICTVAEIRTAYFIFVEKLLAEHGITDSEERKALQTAFSQRFESRILDFEDISDPALTLHAVSVVFVDNKLSGLMSRKNLDRKDYATALKLCNRLNAILYTFRQSNWVLPRLNNLDPAACEAHIHQMQDTDERLLRISQLDAAIDDAFSQAEKELTQIVCDNVVVLLDEMQREIEACTKNNVPVTGIKNADIEALHKKLSEVRKKAIKKAQFYADIAAADAQLFTLDRSNPQAVEQWNDAIAMCKQLNRLISNCKKNQWAVPPLTVENVDSIQRKYAHYLEMVAVDQSISECSRYMESKNLRKPYLSHCKKQSDNIEVCVRSRWSLPPLQNTSPAQLIKDAQVKIAHKEQMKKIKMGLILAGVALLAVFVLICFAVSKSREGKIEVPFSSSYVVSKNYLDIQEELEDAGFTDILLVESKDGWLEDGAVLSVTIDNTDKYTKGAYRDPDVAIVITYSSSGRIDVSDLLANWQSLPYSDIVAQLKDAGFTNITTNAKTTYEAKRHTLIDSVHLNNDVYTNGHAYLPADAPVDITYLDLKIFVSDTNTSFIGRNYEDVVSSLKEDGFTNIQTEEIKTGWAPGNSVISVAINNKTNYDGDDEFSPDVKIVVKFSSNDRVNMTSILSNWNGRDYAMLETSLRSSGFTNLSFKTTATTSKENNQKVAGITINGEAYVGGECHIQKTAPIEITIYVLQITIGRSAGDIEDDYYTDIVAWLKSLGFTKITLKRTNDLVTGWINSEGSIKSISISGNNDFGENAAFDYNAEIVIIVYTFKNKGCEDITIVA